MAFGLRKSRVRVMLSVAKHLLFLHLQKQILRRFAPQNDRAALAVLVHHSAFIICVPRSAFRIHLS